MAHTDSKSETSLSEHNVSPKSKSENIQPTSQQIKTYQHSEDIIILSNDDSMTKSDENESALDLLKYKEVNNTSDGMKQQEIVNDQMKQLENVIDRVTKLKILTDRIKQLKSVIDGVNKLENGIDRLNKLLIVTGRMKQLEHIVNQVNKLEVVTDRMKKLENIVDRVQKLEGLANRVQLLESQLITITSHTNNNQGDQGCYINWNSSHYDSVNGFYVSRVEIKHMLWKINRMSFKSKKDRDQVRKMLNSLTIFKINRTTRFPVGEECIDIKQAVISKSMDDIYASISLQDEIDAAKQLGDEYDKTKHPLSSFKAAINNFESAISQWPYQNRMTGVPFWQQQAVRYTTVITFEKANNLKWEDKQYIEFSTST